MKKAGDKTAAAGVDLDAVSILVHELERDIEKLQHGSGDVGTLRAEVRALGLALRAPAPENDRIHRGLNAIHRVIATIEDDVLIVADYAARIGRMLGM
jgi:hypothetical protein